MQKRTREILALVLLAVLLVSGVVAMGYFILVGHNWNVAASNIDDAIGRMDGYTVILYQGTRPPSDDEEESDRPPANVKDVAADYREKEATVFVVDAANLSLYSDPFIVEKNGKRLGFLSVGNAELRSEARADIRDLVDAKASYLVAVTDDTTLHDLAAEGIINGLSVIICDDPDKESANGKYRGSAYCVSAPDQGRVGAVIISPSGVFSSKVIDGSKESEEIELESTSSAQASTSSAQAASASTQAAAD